MKKRHLCSALALVVLLTGCASLLVSEYKTVTPHTEQSSVEKDDNALTAENYLSLKNAILSFVEDGVKDGVIRIYDYAGDVEEDLDTATYEVSRLDPLGSYAVDYMTHDCALIVSYYEVHIDITYRRTAEQIRDIQRASGTTELTELLERALTAYDGALTVRMSYYNNQDVPEMVRQYYDAHPFTAMQMPAVTLNIYPESGYVRILEILLSYDQPSEDLKEKEEAVATSVRAAKEYVRYRSTETGKLQLLYTYLLERFGYVSGTTSTPVYSFLCEGIADSEGCAKSLQSICDQIGIECYTVNGNKGGEPYYWNIVCVDGVYCHTDMLRSLLHLSETLTLYTDSAMTEYFWDAELYPVCT